MNKPTIAILLRTNFTKLDGTNPVQLRITINRKQKYYTITDVLPGDNGNWDANKNKVKSSDFNSRLKNEYIKKYWEKASKIIYDFAHEERDLSMEEFNRLFLMESYGSKSFYDFIRDQIDNYSNDKSSATIEGYKTELKKLQRFKPDVMFSDINLSFIQDFKGYMKNDLKNNKNTRIKSLKFLSNMLNKAKQNKHIKENPFKEFTIKIGTYKGGRPSLSIDEFKKLVGLYQIFEAKYQVVLKYFLFSCYTGLRPKDIKSFKYGDIRETLHKGVKTKVINLVMHKTEDTVEIPIDPDALKYISTGDDDELVFKTYSMQVTNRYIKEIIDKADIINKKITFYSSRHTFASMWIDKGKDPYILSRILGHTSIKITENYAKASLGKKIDEMMK